MMKTTKRHFQFGTVGGLFLAASIVAPNTALFAQDATKPAAGREKQEQHQQLQSDHEDVKEFKGRIVSAYDYLMQSRTPDSKAETEARDANNRDATGTRNHNPSRSDLAVANSANAASERERDPAARAGDRNTESPDRSWMREPVASTGMNQGPMGLLVQTDGVLELGTGAKFYLLVPRSDNPVNQSSYSQLNRTADPNQARDQSDRTNVRTDLKDDPGATKGAEKLKELSSENAYTSASADAKQGHEVSVMGKVVQRGGLEAIIVHDMSWKSDAEKSGRTGNTGNTGNTGRDATDRDNRDRDDSNNRNE